MYTDQEKTDLHTCDWSEWRKPTDELAGSCYEYRVCLICGAVDAAGEPEEDEDEDNECPHHNTFPEVENGYLVCQDCDATIRILTDEEMEGAHVD